MESTSTQNTQIPPQEKNTYYVEKNIYPTLRRIFLIICVLITVGSALFLIYQNGKSIYESGI